MSSLEDRELLRLAAKASHIYGFVVDAGINTGSNATPIIWNPLTDDGDALRLAVKLGMLFPHIHERFTLFQKNYLSELDNNHQPSIATRCAITITAAEIGRSMP